MNTMLETHLAAVAIVEDSERYWHMSLPVYQEDSYNDLRALRFEERNWRRQRRLRRAQRTAVEAASCALGW